MTSANNIILAFPVQLLPSRTSPSTPAPLPHASSSSMEFKTALTVSLMVKGKGIIHKESPMEKSKTLLEVSPAHH